MSGYIPPMTPDLIEAEALGDTTMRLKFEDGTEKTADPSVIMKGPVFEQILEANRFADFRVDPHLGTIVWYNEADIAPEVLYYM